MRYLIILMALLLSVLLISPVLADDPPQIVAEVNIIGDNPQAYVNLYGDNGKVWVDGVPLEGIINSAMSGAVQNATPNSQWSDRNAGTLPPLSVIPEINTLAPGKYTQAVPANRGYYGVLTNQSPFVYKGAGCGMWGVSEGYPDLWGRRQIAGITIDYTIQKERLAQTQVALVKAIGELNDSKASVASVKGQLTDSIDNLKGITTDLSVMEAEGNAYRTQVDNKLKDLDGKFSLLLVGIIAFAVSFIVMVVIIAIRKNRI
jgi:hypothetical protein